MIGGVFILGKRFTALEVSGVVLIAGGMVIFSWGDIASASNSQDMKGTFLLNIFALYEPNTNRLFHWIDIVHFVTHRKRHAR